MLLCSCLCAPAAALETAPMEVEAIPLNAPSLESPAASAPTTIPPAGDGDVSLNSVLLSVERHYPLLAAALLERDVTDGQLLSAEGAFDLRLQSSVNTIPRGYYRNTRTETLFEQPTKLWGTTLFSGYRLGAGPFPIYDGKQETYEGGEFRGGVRIPILRDGPIDPRRANIEKAAIDRQAADPFIETQRLDFYRGAARVYWSVVAASQRLVLARELLRLARERNTGIATRVRRGDLADIELINNEQLIADRQARLIAAQRLFELTAIDLSLYYRDTIGNPVVLQPDRLPPRFPEAAPYDDARLVDDIQTAMRNRPELATIRLAREKQEVELRLAKNQLLPGVDFAATGSQDVGPPDQYSNKSGFEWELMVMFQMPIQQRNARGKVRSTKGKISQIRAREQFVEDRITAEVRNAASAVTRAYQAFLEFQKSAELARRVAQAEFRRFELGQSNILNVNIQELAANDSAVREVDAHAEYFRAVADYRAALATIAPGADESLADTKTGLPSR